MTTRAAASDIEAFLDEEYRQGRFWPAPLIQLNPSFVPGESIEELVAEGLLHPECARIFRVGKQEGALGGDLRLHVHQEEALRSPPPGAATC